MGSSLSVNRPVANADLTDHGSDFLWAVFAIMTASGLGLLAWTLVTPVARRAFHYVGIGILFTAAVAYFSMASDLGSTPVYVQYVRYGDIFSNTRINPYTRSIWYARYIDWVITTPLLLLELLLSTGLPLSYIMITLFFDLVMIVAGLIGALVPSSYKWGYFAGGVAAQFFLVYVLLGPGRTTAKQIGHHAHASYVGSAIILSLLWLLYPVAWGLADGGNVISTDSEMIFYGVLDVVAKPVFLFYHLWSMRGIPYEQLQLQSGHFSVGSVQYASMASKGSGVTRGHSSGRDHKRSRRTEQPATA